MSGKPPFDGDDDDQITEEVKKGNYKMDDKVWKEISNEAKQLIKLMLNKNYKTRHYARDILENPWFKNASKTAVNRELMIESLKNLKSFSAT